MRSELDVNLDAYKQQLFKNSPPAIEEIPEEECDPSNSALQKSDTMTTGGIVGEFLEDVTNEVGNEV